MRRAVRPDLKRRMDGIVNVSLYEYLELRERVLIHQLSALCSLRAEREAELAIVKAKLAQ